MMTGFVFQLVAQYSERGKTVMGDGMMKSRVMFDALAACTCWCSWLVRRSLGRQRFSRISRHGGCTSLPILPQFLMNATVSLFIKECSIFAIFWQVLSRFYSLPLERFWSEICGWPAVHGSLRLPVGLLLLGLQQDRPTSANGTALPNRLLVLFVKTRLLRFWPWRRCRGQGSRTSEGESGMKCWSVFSVAEHFHTPVRGESMVHTGIALRAVVELLQRVAWTRGGRSTLRCVESIGRFVSATRWYFV